MPGFLTAALLLLSVGSATTARGSPLAWELQFASFQLSPLVFLAAVWALGARRWGETSKEHREFVYMMLGLLGFALVACLVRTGGYALRLDGPALRTAGHAGRDRVRARGAAARWPMSPTPSASPCFGSEVMALSGLAFALVLASPPVASPVYFANTLAVSIVGLRPLCRRASHRSPPGVSVPGLRRGRRRTPRRSTTSWPDACTRSKRWSGNFSDYPDRLPTPFRAILGLVPNIALAGLSLWFVRHWDDRRLARHCHYIGLPLSIAACIWSGFEPLAAVICLSAYAILYVLAVWIFAVPWLTYLAAAALAGACYFGTTLVPGITLADQALAAALLGFAFWAARAQLRRRHAAHGVSRPMAPGGTGSDRRGHDRRELAPRVRWGSARGPGRGRLSSSRCSRSCSIVNGRARSGLTSRS